MLDMTLLRTNPDLVKESARKKRQQAPVDELLALDAKRRTLTAKLDEQRAVRNKVSKEIAENKKAGGDAALAASATSIKEMRKLSDEIAKQEPELKQLEEQIRALALMIPNIAAKDVPEGAGPEDNPTIRAWGEKKQYDFKPKPHWELGKELDILDFERAAKITGSHWPLFKRAGATMERALYNFMLDFHIKRGYVEIAPPYLANRDSMTATAQLPKFEEDMYRCEVDDLFLIPTAEVPVTNIHRDEILDGSKLPIRYAAYSPSFRREAGSYGRDTRALMRVHQFDKVELVKFVEPEKSYEELETLLADAEQIVQQLGLAYRVQLLCTGEMTFASAKTYDIEAWAPGLERWMEISSCSNFEDFQARRANIRYRGPASGGQARPPSGGQGGTVRFVHTLNGSGVALARTILAIIETYQQDDGTIVVPDVLRPYMGGMEVIV